MAINADETSTGKGLASRRAARREATRARSDERYQQIRDAAVRVFHRNGYSATSLEDIATEVGVNRASLYYYVGDKSELLIDILATPLFEMTQNLIDIRELPLPASERLQLAVRKHMETLDTTYPNLFIFFAENLHLPTVGTERDIAENGHRYGETFAAIIADGQQSGEFSSAVDPRIAMFGIVGMCNWTFRWFRSEGTMSLSEIGEQFARLALRGLAPDATES